jgi:hypothetical protein
VRDQVRDRLDFLFEDMGEQQVKNIARPVRVYQVRDRAVRTGRPLPTSPQPLPLPDKPSIAVLPFADMSGNPEREYFRAEVCATAMKPLSSTQMRPPELDLRHHEPRLDNGCVLSVNPEESKRKMRVYAAATPR